MIAHDLPDIVVGVPKRYRILFSDMDITGMELNLSVKNKDGKEVVYCSTIAGHKPVDSPYDGIVYIDIVDTKIDPGCYDYEITRKHKDKEPILTYKGKVNFISKQKEYKEELDGY